MTVGALVVGGGQAAVQIAVSLRERGWTAPITMVSDEPYSPYQRPPLSKAFLAGKADANTLALRSDDFYEREQIEIVRSERIDDAVAPSVIGQEPGRATTSTGRTLPFSHLALAVGAEPRRLDVPGSHLPGIFYLRDIDDAVRLKTHLEGAQSVLVVGGGFIGLEAAAVARARGKAVTVVEASDRLVGRVVAPVVSDFYRGAHERRGTTILLESVVDEFIAADGSVSGARLANGATVEADVVVIGIGVEPRVELAQRLGVECSGGIVVDAHARTSHPRIVAAGDCAVAPNRFAGGELVRLESVQNAVDQAKCAAAAIVGQEQTSDAVPWFWSDQDTLKLQIAGLSRGFEHTVVRGDVAAEKFAVFYFIGEKLIAVDAVNSPREYMAVRRALAEGRNIRPSEAADPQNRMKASTQA